MNRGPTVLTFSLGSRLAMPAPLRETSGAVALEELRVRCLEASRLNGRSAVILNQAVVEPAGSPDGGAVEWFDSGRLVRTVPRAAVAEGLRS